MLPALYDNRSRERSAFTIIGSVLTTKITVEATPARTGTV
jgi:hypothetical protein